MSIIDKLVRNVKSATSDQESLNRQILRLNKSFQEVKKVLNRNKNS